ncbi:MAG TPA: KH domain-containing protein [Chloroflexota bacterium]|nr:KH domain-containing protein [Chloroflexota bacterium]
MTREFIEYVAGALIDHPEEMTLTEVEEDGMTVYQLHVASRDIGKVIGRRGRVARAMRTLLKVASIQNHRRAVLEIE